MFAKRILFVLASLLVLAALWFFRNTLLLAFLAAILAVGLTVPVEWLVGQYWPRALAKLVVALGAVLSALVALLLVWPIIVRVGTDLLTSLPTILENVLSVYRSLRARSEALATLLPEPTLAPGSLSESNLKQLAEQVLQSELLRGNLPLLISGGGVALNLALELALVIFLTFFFFIDAHLYLKASLYLVPKRAWPRVLKVWGELYRTLQTWLSTLLISVTLTFTLVLLVMSALDVPNALFIAATSGVATFVPNLGAFIPLFPISIFTLADDPGKLLVALPAYLLVQLLESNVLTPALVRHRMSLPAAGLLIFQLLSGLVFGLLGLLLAVPLLATAVTVVRELYSYGLLEHRAQRLELKPGADGTLQVLEFNRPPKSQPRLLRYLKTLRRSVRERSWRNKR